MPDSRVQALMDEVREALVLRGRLTAGEEARALDRRLEALYHELGREMGAADNAPREAAPSSSDGGWASDDLEGQLDELDYFSEESTPVLPPEREFTDEVRPARPDFDLALLADFEARLAQRTDEASATSDSEGSATSNDLAGLIDMLAPAERLTEPAELASETSRLQWAARELAERSLSLEVMPSEVPSQDRALRTGLLALLAARAQHLKWLLDDDLGPRMTLARLQRYRIEHGLPVVAGLLPTPRPETGSWEEDVRRWWAWLKASQ